jgi:hypothetical protein
MTKDDITRMAKDAGFCGFDGENKCLREFANLVAETEREYCAKICDAAQLFGNSDERWSAKCCSEAIRARGQV